MAECDRFEAGLFAASTGNSSVTAELDELARKSGLQIQNLIFRHKDVVGRNLTQIDMDLAVSGTYSNIVKFMNSLQRSKSSYAVDALVLQPESQSTPNVLHIGMHMKTYFRTGA